MVGKVSPLSGAEGYQRVLEGSRGLEKTKVRGQVVDKISRSLGFHGGNRGSKPLGTASFQSRSSTLPRPFSPAFLPL